MKYFKKLLALLLILTIGFVGLPIVPVKAQNNLENNNNEYYKKVAELIQSRWKDSYFGKATFSIDDDILNVDNREIKMKNAAKMENGELIIPIEVFEELGIEIVADSQGIKAKNNNNFIEIKYGEKDMRVNGNKKGMPAAAAIKNGNPVLPATVLDELKPEVELVFDEATGEIIITNEFQMARLEVKVKNGKELPQNINAVEVISGPEGLHVLQFEKEEQAREAYEILTACLDIVYVEPDRLVMLRAEPAYDINEMTLAATYAHLGWGPGRIGGDKYLDYLIANGKQNNTVIVAVNDTGLDTNHSYFKGRYVQGYNFINNNTNTIDVHSHGTHVAGTIIDVTIALPNVKIMPVKVLNDAGSGSSIGVANGTRWAADNGAKVINMSLGGGHSQTEDDAIAYATGKGVTVVVAAGNDGADAKNYCPAHNEQAITVAAFDNTNKPASWSNFGACVDVAAPGVSIVSTIPGGGTGSKSGTSMASPHVAGAVALLLCDNPNLTPTAVKAMIRANVDAYSVSNNRYYGTGILNIGKAAGDMANQFIIANPGNIHENIRTGAKTKQLNIEFYDNGKIMNITNMATYMSNNANIATVSATGLVTVRGVGQANIVVSYNGKSITIPVVGENIEPLIIKGSVPANGATNINLNPVITLNLNRRLAEPVSFTLVDTAGRSVSWKQQTIGATYVNIALSAELRAGMEYTFTVKPGGIIDELGETIENNFIFKFTTETGELRITTTALEKGRVALAYNGTIAAAGGIAPYTFTATGLPKGLNMNAQGAITGTPQEEGTFNVRVTVKDAQAAIVNKDFQLVIDPPPKPPVITTLALVNGKVGTAYNATIVADEGLKPYVFTATGLPKGLNMNTQGVISGTPTEYGIFDVNIAVKDANNMTANKILQLIIKPQGIREKITFVDKLGANDNKIYTKVYEIDIKAAGRIDIDAKYTGQGNPTFTMYLIKDGKTIATGQGNKEVAVISANLNQAGKYELKVEVSKKAVDYNITVLCPEIEQTLEPSIITAELNKGKVGIAYNQQILAVGENAPYTFTATGLPKGLNMNAGGVISGIPEAAGTFNVNITVKDAKNLTANKMLQLVIDPNASREVIKINDVVGAKDNKNTYTKTHKIDVKTAGQIDIEALYDAQGNPPFDMALVKDGKTIATGKTNKGVSTLNANIQPGQYEIVITVSKVEVKYDIKVTLP